MSPRSDHLPGVRSMAVPRRCLMWPSPSPDPTADPRRTAALPDVAMSPPKIHIYRVRTSIWTGSTRADQAGRAVAATGSRI